MVLDAALPPAGWILATEPVRFGGWLDLIAQVEALLAPPEDLGSQVTAGGDVELREHPGDVALDGPP